MAVDESDTSIDSTASEQRETSHDTSELTEIDWVRYVKQTQRDESNGIYRVVTGCGVLAIGTHTEEIELAGFTVQAIASANDYGLELYVSPSNDV